MNFERVRPIVDAVLYEGYLLYPYRASATKNRKRWTFGGVYPRAWCESGNGDDWQMQTQCLLEGGSDTRLKVSLRFLQPLAREVGALRGAWPQHGEPEFEPVDVLRLGSRSFSSCQEGIERELVVFDGGLAVLPAAEAPLLHAFAFERSCRCEPLHDDEGRIGGVLRRRGEPLRGRVLQWREALGNGCWRISLRVHNDSVADVPFADREQASLQALASTHVLLGTERGAFVSLIDPPPALAAAAEACDNRGSYPVLVGEPGSRDLVLCSPIILYDHPQVAPESPGDWYDATEIDELLSLTVRALGEEEQREIADTDPRAAALLERARAMDGNALLQLHGTLREPRANGCHVPAVGTRVRLKPRPAGDIFDLALAGRTAVVEAVEQDFEGRLHVAVTLDDDPGRDLGVARMPGHRFFFAPEETEPLPEAPP